MQLGSQHDETGLLNRNLGGYVLERDDGGTWRLDIDIDCNVTAYLEHRVRITAQRIGFDVLDVYSIELPNNPYKRIAFASRWQFILGFLSVWTAAGFTVAVISWWRY